jgi:hypothetical protein
LRRSDSVWSAVRLPTVPSGTTRPRRRGWPRGAAAGTTQDTGGTRRRASRTGTPLTRSTGAVGWLGSCRAAPAHPTAVRARQRLSELPRGATVLAPRAVMGAAPGV